MKTLFLVFTLLFSFTSQENIPQEVYKIAKRGNKVYVESHDQNAATHAKNAIESWGYWSVTENKHQADFILKFHHRFEGAGVCIANATFMNPRNKKVIYATKEVTSVKKAQGFDFNTKRSAMRQVIEQIFKPNFN